MRADLPAPRLLSYGIANGRPIHARVYLACEIEAWARENGVTVQECRGMPAECCRRSASLEVQEVLATLPPAVAGRLRAALGML